MPSPTTTALILVDLQHDFMPGGALGVAHADEVIDVARDLMARHDVVVATQDWHPPDHQSFATEHPGKQPGDQITLHGLTQTLWPVHCVQGTQGAALVPGLDLGELTHVVRKGSDKELDSYSGFYDNGRRQSTGLEAWLRDQGITDLVVMGIATDYCVKFTVLDALAQGFGVEVVVEGCRAVELETGDGERALAQMKHAGALLR